MNSATPDWPRIRRSPVRNPQLFAALVLFALLAIASRPASAQTYARAWVWSTYTDTTTHTWTPSLAYQYNSQGGTNVITHLGTGYYRVDMPGINPDYTPGGGGTALVTAYGGNQTCNPSSWLMDSGGVHVYVECYNTAGNPSNALFDAFYYRRGNGWFQAYVWANNATASSYIPYLAYQWNSVGLTNSITRSGTGSYVVTIPGFPWNTGTVAVSAYGSLSQRCKSTGWYASSSNMLVGVACTNGGQPADAQFTLTFTNTLELGSTGAYLGAFAWADQPTNPSCYTPATSYQYNFEASPLTACRTALGHYAVYIPHAPNGVGGNQTTVLTTAYAGPSGSYCNVQNWITYSSEWVAYVSCYDSAGNSLDSKYTVQLLTDDLYNIP